MHISIKATQIELTLSIKEYVEKRCGAFEKFFSDIEDSSITVEVGKTTNHHKSGDIFKTEMQSMYKGDLVRAVAEASDLYHSIDKAHDELFRILSSKKEKRFTRFIRGAYKIKELVKGLRPWKKKG